jgi:hypothetical protein
MIRRPSPRAIALDAELAVHAREKRIADHQIAILLAEVQAQGIHLEFGHANIAAYARVRHGIGCGAARCLLGERLRELPVLNQAMAAGEVDWTKAREVVRVATPETEAAWTEIARTVTNRVLECAIAAAEDGLPPTHVALEDLPGPVRMTIRLDRESAEILHATLTWLRSSSGITAKDLDDGQLLALMAQRLLADANPVTAPSPDRARFVVVNAAGVDRADPVQAELHAEARCDAQVVEMAHGPERGHASHTIPPATRRAVLYRDNRQCQVPDCTNRMWLDIHHVEHRADGGSNAETNLVCVCDVHHRLVHRGRLGIVAEAGGFRFVFPDGREQFVRSGRSTLALPTGTSQATPPAVGPRGSHGRFGTREPRPSAASGVCDGQQRP